MEPIFEFPIELPPAGSRDLVRSLHQQLRDAILDGRLKPDLRLPPTRALAEGLGVSRNTAVAVYDMLLSEGYVEGRAGSGTYVADVRPRLERPKAPDRKPEDDTRLAPFWRGKPPPEFSPNARPPAFDFLSGYPDTTEFPFDIWNRLSGRAARALARQPAEAGDPAGEPGLRDAIANHISFARAVACSGDDIVVTAGARQAFDLLARVLVTPGQTEVALEDPGYAPTRNAFAAAGARIAPIPVDEDGLIVERIPPSVRVVCVTPSHQFPMGVTLSAKRRAALLDFAETFGASIIEDDYDSEFRLGGRPLDALQTLDQNGRVFYVGTFSKSMFPALRMGFVTVPDWAKPAVTGARHLTDWHAPSLTQQALTDFITEGHLARHVRKMRREYAARHETLTAALSHFHGGRMRVLEAHAGVHLSAVTDSGKEAEALTRRAAERSIRLDTLGAYSRRDDAPTGLVFGYGLIQRERIEEAVARLA
ncbi:MAG: PLP-dependent aminotransferase family protein [Alphaproteobacteria bacterium]|nr:PLP-dependent aminotransferase family protein [Alphaproteobacteria bacterium]